MPNPGEGWTRREFLRGAGGVVALQHLPRETGAEQFAYVGCGDDLLRMFGVRGGLWTLVQKVRSRAPACVLLSPSRQTLFVANEVDVHDGLARGTVEAFHIDAADGRLRLLSRIALSLSATRPRHMAVSPDGKLLAVAAYGGGIYNLIAIAEDGSLGQVGSIFKDAGCGPHGHLQGSAHPHTLLFNAGGQHLLSSDFGSDRLSVFEMEGGQLRRSMACSTGEGSGPGDCVLHPSESFIYVRHRLEGRLVCYQYGHGNVGKEIHRWPLCGGGLAVHPSGRMLYTGGGAWEIDAGSGRLARAGAWAAGGSEMVVLQEGTSVLFLDGASGSITQAATDSRTGEIHCKTKVAAVDRPRSIALKTI